MNLFEGARSTRCADYRGFWTQAWDRLLWTSREKTRNIPGQCNVIGRKVWGPTNMYVLKLNVHFSSDMASAWPIGRFRWEFSRPRPLVPGGVHLFRCAPIGAWEEPASNPRHRSLTTVRDDDERSRRDDVSQNCPRRGEFDRPVSEKTAGWRAGCAGSVSDSSEQAQQNGEPASRIASALLRLPYLRVHSRIGRFRVHMRDSASEQA